MRVPVRLGPPLAIGGWLLAAAGATIVALLAVNDIGSGLSNQGPEPLTNGQVADALSAAGSTTPPPSRPAANPPATTTSPDSSGTRVISSPAGTILARCSGGQVTLLSWSPAQGYETDNINRGPAPSAGLEFESDGAEFKVHVTCHAGQPTASISKETDHDD